MGRADEPGSGVAESARPLSAEEQRDLLLDIARRSRGTLDLQQTLDRLLDAVGGVVEYDAAGIFALTEVLGRGDGPPAARIVGVARRGYLERPVADDRMLSGGEGLVGHAIRAGISVLARDVRREPQYIIGRRETLSEVVVPIRVDGRAIAALDVESDRLGAFDESDLVRLEFFAEAAAMAIEKAILHRNLVELEQIGAQLKLARQVQMGLLPAGPPEIPGWEVAGMCRPSLELGGDLYDHFELSGGRWGLVIGDVAGKGVPAALIMTTFRALLRARRSREDLESGGPARTVAAVSRLLRETATGRGFVTCCYAALAPATGELVYASCGHPPGLVLRRGGTIEELVNCGPALGVFEHEEFVDRRLTLDPGEVLVLFTDGLTESENPDGEPFGGERVRAALAGLRRAGAAAVADGLARSVVAFAAPAELGDDLTLLVVRRLPEPR
jgi:sigma-B regulation protein RsbU (phosphoserine phosphatase)